MMSQADFDNSLRVLSSIDAWELRGFLDGDRRALFMDNPVRFLLNTDDETADAIWRVIEARQPKRKIARPE